MAPDREQWTCPKCGASMHPRKCRGHSKRDGKHCGDWAEQGAEVCRRHGARAPQVKAKAKQRIDRAEAEKQLRRLNVTPRQVDPHDALLEVLSLAAGYVDLLRGLVEANDDDGLTQWGATGQTESALWKMLAEERAHMLAAAKACVAAGIAQQRVDLAKEQGRMLADAFRAFATALGLNPADERVRAAMRASLTVVAGGQAA